MVGSLLSVVGALTPSIAAAEIYAWIDPSGDVTYSNLPPPKNARVFDVIRETPPPTAQEQAAAEAAHQAQMRVLNDKVQQLEQELQQTRWQASAPVPYPAGAPPSYGPPPSYASASSYGGCDPEYFDCSSWDGPIYSVGVFPWGFRGHRDHDHDHDRDGFHHGFHHFPHSVGGPHFAGGRAVHAGGHGSGSHASASMSGSMGHGR
jgi:hypothetical protein